MEAELRRTNSAKISLRKSGKRVDNVINSSTEFIAAIVTKDGSLQLLQKDKWRSYYFALCGGVLYWKKKESSTSILGEISLKGCVIEKSSSLSSKTNFAFTITTPEKSFSLSADKEQIQDEWIAILIENIDRTIPSPTSTKKDTRMLRAQKKVGGSIATTAAGKKIIKEALGAEGYKGISIVKKVVALVDGKKKAAEVEDSLIKLGVKMILLSKNKDLTLEDLRKHKSIIKAICDSMAHHVTFVFEYKPGPDGNVHTLVNQFVKDIGSTLANFFSPKNMARYNDLHAYITSGPIIDALFLDPKLKDFRNQWHYLMKNISYRIDMLV